MVPSPVEPCEPGRIQLVGGLVVDEPELWRPRAELWLRALVARVRRSWRASDDGDEQLELAEPVLLAGQTRRAANVQPLIEQLLVGTVAGAELPWHGYLVLIIDSAEPRASLPGAPDGVYTAAQWAEETAKAARDETPSLVLRVAEPNPRAAKPGSDANRWLRQRVPALAALWGALWTIPTSWTRRQWQLHQQFTQVGPKWTQVAAAARMSLSACSHMAARMHHDEWVSGVRAWLQCLDWARQGETVVVSGAGEGRREETPEGESVTQMPRPDQRRSPE